MEYKFDVSINISGIVSQSGEDKNAAIISILERLEKMKERGIFATSNQVNIDFEIKEAKNERIK